MQIYVGLLIYLQIYVNWKKTVIMKNFNLLKVFVHCENTVVSPSIKHTTFNTHFHFENKLIEKKNFYSRIWRMNEITIGDFKI